MVLGVLIVERELLLAICRIIGVVEVKHNGRRRLCITGDESIHEGPCKSIQVFPVYLGLQTRQGRGTGSIVGRIQGRPLHPEFEQGVPAETIGIIGIRIPCGDLIDALGAEVSQRMINRGLMPFITHRRREPLGQANLTVNAP
jgi:hypothetical protein